MYQFVESTALPTKRIQRNIRALLANAMGSGASDLIRYSMSTIVVSNVLLIMPNIARMLITLLM